MKIKILNPVYDSVFKILLANNFVAKGLISRIIGQEIKELTPLPTERGKNKFVEKYKIAIYRLDYVALVKNEQGKYEHLTIEMQKSAITPHLERFREYIGDEFRRKVPVKQADGTEKEMFLPITTIYFIEKSFNKKLPPILLSDKIYYDVLNNKKFSEEVGDLVKCLTNKAYFIQTTNLPENMKGDLEIFNSFSNHLVVSKNDDRILELPYEDIDNIKDPVYREAVKILMPLVADKAIKDKMQDEKSIESYLDGMNLQLRKNKIEIEKKDSEIEKKDSELKEKDKKILELAKLLKENNIPTETIKEKTGLTNEQIENL